MADNITLNAGSGGATVRTLSDASGNEWIPATICYATSTTPGAATFQFVDATHGMPVAVIGTVPVSGTFWQTTQPVSITSLPLPAGAAQESGGHLASIDGKVPALGQALATASVPVVLPAAQVTALTPPTTVAVTGTFWQSTQPVSAASLPLPSGAAQDSSVNGLLVSQGSTTSGEKGPLIQGAVTTAAPTYATGQTAPLSLDTGGGLRTTITNTSLAMTQDGPWTIELQDGSGNTLASFAAGSIHALAVGLSDGAGAQAGIASNPIRTDPTGATTQPVSIQAGTSLIGQMAAGQQVASLFNGTTAVTPQYAKIAASALGATTIVAGVTGKRIYILRWSLSSNGNVNINWQSHTTTTTATGLHYLTQYASAGGSYCPAGIFATESGEGLDINLSAAVAVGGELTYVQF